MRATRIHWGRIVVAGFLAEASIVALFFLLLFVATLAGVPESARPMTPLDYADAMISSFAMPFVFTLWVGRRIGSGFVVHGVLIGAVGIILFGALWLAGTGSLNQPPLYLVAHALKIAGGAAGGLVAERRWRAITAARDAHVGG